jgi:hypothetical protein
MNISKTNKMAINGIKCIQTNYYPLFFSDLPSSGPKIKGVDSKYHLGDQITASCISPVSFPPAVLSWYINSDSADPSFISNQSQMTFHSDSPILSDVNMKYQLESLMKQRSEADRSIEPSKYFHTDTSIVYEHLQDFINTPNDMRNNHHQKKNPARQLNFTVKPKQLVMPGGGLSLKCTAEVLDLYWRSSEVETQVITRPNTWSLTAFSHAVATNINIRSFLLLNIRSILLFLYFLKSNLNNTVLKLMKYICMLEITIVIYDHH